MTRITHFHNRLHDIMHSFSVLQSCAILSVFYILIPFSQQLGALTGKKGNPRDAAQRIMDNLPDTKFFDKVIVYFIASKLSISKFLNDILNIDYKFNNYSNSTIPFFNSKSVLSSEYSFLQNNAGLTQCLRNLTECGMRNETPLLSKRYHAQYKLSFIIIIIKKLIHCQ